MQQNVDAAVCDSVFHYSLCVTTFYYRENVELVVFHIFVVFLEFSVPPEFRLTAL